MSYWPNFILKRRIIVPLPHPCALIALCVPGRGKTHKMASAPRQDSDQYVQSSLSEWGVCQKEHSEDWSNCVDVQAYQWLCFDPTHVFLSISLTILRPLRALTALWDPGRCKTHNMSSAPRQDSDQYVQSSISEWGSTAKTDQTLWMRRLISLRRTLLIQDQDQDSLQVKRRNDNHSPGPVIGELVPRSHQKSELSNTILCIFSRWDQRIGEGIPIPDSLG